MKKTAIAALMLAASTASWAQYSHIINADNLGRGVLAVKAENGVFVSWRSLPSDDAKLAFDVYRDGVKVNETPLSKMTNFTDPDGSVDSKYTIKAILNGVEMESANANNVWASDFMKIHLNRPEGGTSPAGGSKEQREYTYTPDDVSVGDVDGDGEFEFIVKWFPTNQADNGDQFRYTGYTILDCYKLDGTQLWRIDLGQNIRSGNHYTQFMVYDFDGDGKAELICKTAPGTIDGKGKAVLLGDDKVTDDYREKSGSLAGVVKSGPEYLTVFNGETGAEINTIYYNPPRNIQAHSKSGWGDANGNRCERYLAGVAYLDGVKPSAIFVRGYYTHSYVWAVDFDGKELKEKWLHKSEKAGQGIYGQGTHSLSIADLDGDGFDEIIIGSGALDHDGSFLHSTGGGHGDALHVGDFILENEGLEIFMPHEDKKGKYATTLRDGKTGKLLYYQAQPTEGKDVGRGLIANVSSKFSGSEYWSSLDGNVMNSGEVVGSKRPSVNFRIFWDGDLLDELLDGTTITKPNNDLTSVSNVKVFGGTSHAASCNSTKATPNLQADIFGDWREEVILHDSQTQSDLIIFTTTIPSDYKVPCLMTDRQYREAIAWQNVAYNQPPHLSYNLEAQYDTRPRIVVTSGALLQSISLGGAIDPIEFSVMHASGAKVSGLPDGVEFTFDSENGKGYISGTPSEKGEWTYTITTTGAEDDDNVSISGTIRVTFIDKSGRCAYFSFDAIGATTVANDYKTGTVADIKGTVGSTEGISKGAIAFDGNGYLTQPVYDELMFGSDDFSIELWMKSTDDDGYLFCIGSHNKTNVEGGTGNWVGLERLKNDATDRLCFSIDDDVTKTDCYALNPGKYFDGEWHHIVCVRNNDAKSTSIYIDGKQNMSSSNAGTGAINFDPRELMFIGGDDEPTAGRENRKFNGSIDEFTIYPFVLSAEEIKANFDRFDPSAVEEIIAVSGDAEFSVIDAFSGRIVKTAKGESGKGITSGLEKGIYVLIIDNGSSKQTHKFIKK
ncbi:MAG: T9SS type A sorting domain-containing protein [Muribaculaceae bacterium]|nr:T9SS type A sorting domain-containing protein [Muribaculaceae bacterium]